MIDVQASESPPPHTPLTVPIIERTVAHVYDFSLRQREELCDCLCYFHHSPLLFGADVVNLSNVPFVQYGIERLSYIFYVKI